MQQLINELLYRWQTSDESVQFGVIVLLKATVRVLLSMPATHIVHEILVFRRFAVRI